MLLIHNTFTVVLTINTGQMFCDVQVVFLNSNAVSDKVIDKETNSLDTII